VAALPRPDFARHPVRVVMEQEEPPPERWWWPWTSEPKPEEPEEKRPWWTFGLGGKDERPVGTRKRDKAKAIAKDSWSWLKSPFAKTETDQSEEKKKSDDASPGFFGLFGESTPDGQSGDGKKVATPEKRVEGPFARKESGPRDEKKPSDSASPGFFGLFAPSTPEEELRKKTEETREQAKLSREKARTGREKPSDNASPDFFGLFAPSTPEEELQKKTEEAREQAKLTREKARIAREKRIADSRRKREEEMEKKKGSPSVEIGSSQPIPFQWPWDSAETTPAPAEPAFRWPWEAPAAPIPSAAPGFRWPWEATTTPPPSDGGQLWLPGFFPFGATKLPVQAPEKTPQSPVVKSSSKQLDRAYKIVSGGKECGEFIISPATLKASERFGGPMTLFKRFGAEAGGCDSLGYTVLDRDEVKRWPIIGKVDVKIYRRP